MATLDRFMTYAAAFEQTLADDDWERLAPFFHEDAVYRVESDLFGCELTGAKAIFEGMKKSLDGFDRVFGSRDIETDPPQVDGDELRVAWTIAYHREGVPDFVLRGESFARYRGDRLELLVDSYDPSENSAMAEWTRETGLKLDPSYT